MFEELKFAFTPFLRMVMAKHQTIHAVIADSSRIVVESLSSNLTRDRRISIVGTASSAQELIAVAKASQPDLILTSVHLENVDGAEWISTLRLLLAEVRIIVFSVYDLLMTRIIFLEAGADVVVQGNQLPERIAAQIRRLFP